MISSQKGILIILGSNEWKKRNGELILLHIVKSLYLMPTQPSFVNNLLSFEILDYIWSTTWRTSIKHHLFLGLLAAQSQPPAFSLRHDFFHNKRVTVLLNISPDVLGSITETVTDQITHSIPPKYDILCYRILYIQQPNSLIQACDAIWTGSQGLLNGGV